MDRSGIPTTYRHFRFRSRLEAIWARFFDLLGWPWKYEPFDYDGYIPDFVLLLPAGNILVEVKPCLDLEELEKHAEKIDASPWTGEALIVGVGLMPWLSNPEMISAARDLGITDPFNDEMMKDTRDLGLLRHFDCHPESRTWGCCVIHRDPDHVGFFALTRHDWCRYTGCDHFQFHHGGDWFDEQWALAQNLVQWSPRLFGFDPASR